MKDKVISFYEGPIKTTEGNFPTETWTLEQVYEYIVSDKGLEAKTHELRFIRAGDEKAYKLKKGWMLPFVSAAGLFRYRDTEGLIQATGDLVVDIDGLPTRERARQLRDTLFEDETLKPDLAYVSPSDFGTKLFIPYEHRALMKLNDCYVDAVHAVWGYLAIKYGIDEFIDKKNIDIARASFLAHDADAKLRDNFIINHFNSYTHDRIRNIAFPG